MMQIPQPDVPLYQAPIGLGTGPTPLSLNVQLPQQDFGPQLAMAEFENRLNQRTIELGFQLSQAAIEASEDAIVSREIRRIVMGDQDGETIRQRAAQIVANNIEENRRNERGGPVFDATQIGQEITSIQELEEALIAMDFESWDEVIKAAIPALEQQAMGNMGILGRGRVRRWIQDRADEIRSKYALEAAQRHQQITISMFEEELKVNIEAGNIDGALNLIDQMQYLGVVGPQRASLMRFQASEQAPVQKIINEIARAIAEGQSDTVVRDVLEKYRERIGPETEIVENETGRALIRNITQNQYDVIADNIERRLADRNRLQQQQDNQRVQQIDAELQQLFEKDMLTDGYLQSLDLLGEEKEQFTRLHRYWRAVLDNENENSRRQAEALRNARLQQSLDESQAFLEDQRNDIKANLIARVQQGTLNTRNLSFEIQEMMALPDPINGGRLFDSQELLTFQRSLANMLTDENINMSFSAYNYLNEILDGRIQASRAGDREEVRRINNQARQVFYNQQELLIQRVESGQIDQLQYEQQLRNAVDEIISIDFDKGMIGDTRLDNMTMVLAEDARLVLGQRPTERSLRAFQEGNLTLLGFTPVAEAQHRIADITRIAVQDIIMSAPDRITYEPLYDANEQPLIRQPIRDLNISLLEDRRSISNFVTQDRNVDVVDFQVRIGNDGKAMLHIRDFANRQWVSVQDLNDRQMVVFGVNPNYRRDERNIFQRVTQNIFDTPAPQTPQDRLREFVFMRDELQKLVDRGPDRTPASTDLIGMIRRYGFVLGTQTRSRERVLRNLNREIEALQESIERSRSEAEQRRGM